MGVFLVGGFQPSGILTFRLVGLVFPLEGFLALRATGFLSSAFVTAVLEPGEGCLTFDETDLAGTSFSVPVACLAVDVDFFALEVDFSSPVLAADEPVFTLAGNFDLDSTLLVRVADLVLGRPRLSGTFCSVVADLVVLGRPDLVGDFCLLAGVLVVFTLVDDFCPAVVVLLDFGRPTLVGDFCLVPEALVVLDRAALAGEAVFVVVSGFLISVVCLAPVVRILRVVDFAFGLVLWRGLREAVRIALFLACT